MNAVYGLYPDGHAAQEAVDRLRAAGVDEDDITILSSQPMEDFEFGRRGRENWMWWTASLGGLVGGLFGTWLTRATQQAWPLETGGMPIAIDVNYWNTFTSTGRSPDGAVHDGYAVIRPSSDASPPDNVTLVRSSVR